MRYRSGRSRRGTGEWLNASAMDARRVWFETALFVGLTVLVRLPELRQDPHIDEFFHILAARSWLAEGELRIADGIYDRGALYTMLLGWWFGLFGDGLTSARLPSVIAGSLWVAAVFLWTRRAAGAGAAWAAGALFALAPGAIWLSQFTRFYAVHGLLFWLGAVGVYRLFSRPLRPIDLAVIPGVALCFGIALHLQLITVIGLLGLGLWVAGVVCMAWLRADLPRRTRTLGVIAAAALAIVGAAVLLRTGLAVKLWETYRDVTYWNAEVQAYEAYYFNLFLAQYPTLWPFLPVAALVAVVSRPRPALFAATVFGTAFLLHSFAGNKLERYIYYAMPFLFVLWGIALAQVLPAASRWLLAVTDRGLAALHLDKPEWLRRSARWGVPAAAAAFLVVANPAFTQTAESLLNPREPVRTRAWNAARERLGPLLDRVDVLVTTDELRSLYYLGRSDILLNRIRLMETPKPAEFKDDPRTGRPIIAEFASFARVLDCYPSGLFITEERYWGSAEHGGPEAAALLTERADPIPLPESVNPPGPYRLRIYRWDRMGPVDPARCASLPNLTAAAEER